MYLFQDRRLLDVAPCSPVDYYRLQGRRVLLNITNYARSEALTAVSIKIIILQRVLAMVYNTQDYWVFGLLPSFGILKNTKEHNVSETGSVSVLR
jgi:hypothetical protein